MGHGLVHIHLYEGDEDPRQHWFVYESTWEENVVTNEDRQMAQFVGALQKQALTWYMTCTEKMSISTKAQIKHQFMSFFKTPYAKHLAVKKLKTTVQKPTETVWEYDKRFKYLLIQLDYNIDEQLLIQWFFVELLQNI